MRNYIKVALKNVINIDRIVSIFYFEFSPYYKTRGESHDFWEIVYVDSGELDVYADDKLIHLKRGEMIFHQPDEFHKIMCDGENTANIFIISFECKSAAMRFFSKKQLTIPVEHKWIISSIIDEAVRNFNITKLPLAPLENAPIGGQQLIKLYLEMFLIKVMRLEKDGANESTFFTSRQNLQNKLVNDIIKYLQDRIYEKVTLEDMSRHFHFGVSHLCNVFKKNTGNTIIRYFLELKIDEAKNLLRKRKDSVAHIAETLNFESPQYFTRIFKQYVGMSPREFQNSVANSRIVRVKK